MRLTIVSALACLVATTAVALADNGNRQKIRFNAADQAAARAAVLRRSDLGSGADWKGGARKPDLTQTDPCPNYNPKQSDLVLTGIAETQFTQTFKASRHLAFSPSSTSARAKFAVQFPVKPCVTVSSAA